MSNKRQEVRDCSRWTFGFNTCRLYQNDGQRISVAEMTDGKILFFDHSRGIYGDLLVGVMTRDRLSDAVDRGHFAVAASIVMRHYDANQYTFDLTGRADAVQADTFTKVKV